MFAPASHPIVRVPCSRLREHAVPSNPTPKHGQRLPWAVGSEAAGEDEEPAASAMRLTERRTFCLPLCRRKQIIQGREAISRVQRPELWRRAMSRSVLVRIAIVVSCTATVCVSELFCGAALGQNNHNRFGPGGPSADVLSPGFSQNSVHDPFSSKYNPLLPSNTGIRTFSAGVTYGNAFYGSGFFYGNYYPYYNPYGYGYGYPYYYPRRFYGGVAPWVAPIVVPVVPVQVPQVNFPVVGNNAVGGFGELAPAEPAERVRNKPRASTAEAKARAAKQIELGDASFSRQSFLDATQHYRSAASAAADLADPLFRQGFSLFALGRFDAAAKMFRKALEMDPDWAASGFRLASLYGDNQLAKGAHLDALAQTVTKGQNSDLLFLLGLVLFADQEPDRARPFLARARDLNVGDAAHISGFLKQIDSRPAQIAGPADPAGAPAAPAARAVPIAAGKPVNDVERATPAEPKPIPSRPAKPGSVDL
jgi:tetratricopeptide (TPR) repeat protein